MGFSSMDDFINKITNLGQTLRTDWNKNFLPTTAAVAGEWFALARGAGNPGLGAIYNTGTNLAFQSTSDSDATAAGIQHGGNVSPDYKRILNASAFTAAPTVAPCILMLVDMVGFYRVTSTTTITSQATTIISCNYYYISINYYYISINYYYISINDYYISINYYYISINYYYISSNYYYICSNYYCISINY